MFYARLYTNDVNQILHTSTSEIDFYTIDPTGYSVYNLIVDRNFLSAQDFLTQLSVVDGVVISSGSTIISQVKL